ncbi:hypothetical protein DSECCO2_383560 [anaerobic digester metagenome]|jgi:hypothetical protein
MSGKFKKKFKKKKKSEPIESYSDENFAFIAGYTSGGAPYCLTRDEMAEIEKESNEALNPNK